MSLAIVWLLTVTLVAGLIKSHESVTDVGAVTLRLSNVTGGGVSLVTADWRFVVTRPK